MTLQRSVAIGSSNVSLLSLDGDNPLTELEVFRFPATGQEIRTLIRDGEMLVCHTDVCVGLQHSNPSVAIKLVDADDRVLIDLTETDIPNLKRTSINPNMWFLTEAGFYTLAIASQASNAKTFRRWITHDVLPTIRRTGRYGALDTNTPRHLVPQSFADALQLAADQARQIEQQGQQIAELEPRAEQADHFRRSDGLKAVAAFCNDLQLWAYENHRVKLRHDDIRDFLGDIRLVIRTDSLRKNEPYGEAIKDGYVRPRLSTYDTNTRGSQEATSARLTPKGWGYAWDRAVKRIAEHGSLAPITSVAIPAQSLPTERS
jgi:anti-repressor protein